MIQIKGMMASDPEVAEVREMGVEEVEVSENIMMKMVKIRKVMNHVVVVVAAGEEEEEEVDLPTDLTIMILKNLNGKEAEGMKIKVSGCLLYTSRCV